MIYNHLNIQVPKIAKQLAPDGSKIRLYETPEGMIYPSITTILSPLKTEILARWREKVGVTVANFESNWAKDRGSALHLAIEKLLQNENISGHPLLVKMLVEDLKPYLRKINNIHCQEQVLYSDRFKIGGRCDLIAEYDGKLSVIDFKGSNRTKKKEWIDDYFIQCSFYAYAYWERTHSTIKQIVILIANERGAASEFVEIPWNWWEKLKEIRKQFKEVNGI